MKNAGCYLLALILVSSDCLASPPFSEQTRKQVLSPYLFLDPTFNCPYWRWMQEERKEEEKKICQHRGYQTRPYERPQASVGIRPTGHKTYFMNVPIGRIN